MHCTLTPGVIKLFHVKNPQIDIYCPADPHLKMWDPNFYCKINVNLTLRVYKSNRSIWFNYTLRITDP